MPAHSTRAGRRDTVTGGPAVTATRRPAFAGRSHSRRGPGPTQEHVMATTASNESLSRLHRDLGLSPLSHWWGRAEIFLGLLAMGLSMVLLLDQAVEAIRATVPRDPLVNI